MASELAALIVVWQFRKLDGRLQGRQPSRGDLDLQTGTGAAPLDPAILKDAVKHSIADGIGQLRYHHPVSGAEILHNLALTCADPDAFPFTSTSPSPLVQPARGWLRSGQTHLRSISPTSLVVAQSALVVLYGPTD
jgi:hypothetical protein